LDWEPDLSFRHHGEARNTGGSTVMSNDPNKTAPEDDDWWEDDYDRDPDWSDPCDHDKATLDILTDELSCSCGYRQYLTDQEFRREAERQVEAMIFYAEECARERR
jgi:outer membrane protease